MVGGGEWAGAGNVGFDGFDIHQVGLNLFVNRSAELAQDVEAAIVYICPEVNRGGFGKEAQDVADRRGGIAVGTQNCMGRVACSVVYLFTCVPVYLPGVLMEGSEVFDAEDGFGTDGLKGGGLRDGEADGGGEAAQVENLSAVGGELPVA